MPYVTCLAGLLGEFCPQLAEEGTNAEWGGLPCLRSQSLGAACCHLSAGTPFPSRLTAVPCRQKHRTGKCRRRRGALSKGCCLGCTGLRGVKGRWLVCLSHTGGGRWGHLQPGPCLPSLAQGTSLAVATPVPVMPSDYPMLLAGLLLSWLPGYWQ